MLEFLKTIQPLLKAILPPLIFVWLGYKFGIVKYLKEKESELIIKRYLENGVDKVIAGVEHALSVHNENWKRGLSLLKNSENPRMQGLN